MQVPVTGAVGQRLPSWLGRDWFWGLILVLAVILVYQPVWYAGFIWDDDYHVTANPCIVGPFGLKEIWTTQAALICPLVLTTFWVEHALWGLQPLPYHLVNVLLHAVSAILLWRVLRSLRVPGAWLGAALWALHPLQVESVAWISEMKNTQSGLFYLLTILFYVRWLKARAPGGRTSGGWNYALTLLFAALAMASKTSTLILPLLLCLCAWWMEGRWHWRNLLSLVPIFLLSIIASAVTLWPRKEITAFDDPQWAQSWPQRVARTGDVIWFYLGKLAWPHPLITIYPRWQIDAGQWNSYLPLLAAIIVLFVLWLKRETWSRPYFFALSYFLIVLLPFLGLINQFFWIYSFVEDHLQYLAGMGPLALAGAGMARVADFVIPGRRWLVSTLGAGVLVVLGILSWQRAWVYESEETLWTDTLAKNPNCWVGYSNLGLALVSIGRVDEAIAHYQKAVEIYPNYFDAYNNLGWALFYKRGQTDEAIAQYRKALEINPRCILGHNNLGTALLQKGQVDEAIVQLQKALELDPNSVEAHNNLGGALLKKGQVNEAMIQYQKALELDPNYAGAHNNLGNVLLHQGRVDEAIAQFQKVLEINPNDADAHNNLANILFQGGRVPEAIEHYRQALRVRPDFIGGLIGMGNALARTGRTAEAIDAYNKILALDPHNGDAHFNLAHALMDAGRFPEARDQYQLGLQINPNFAEGHNNLGVLWVQAGQMDKARDEFNAALKIDPSYDQARSNLKRLQDLQKGSPAKK